MTNMDGLSLSLLLPITIGFGALAVWIATLFMFKPEARLDIGREAIVLKLTNARILGIERSGDELIVHVDRDIGEVMSLAA